MKRLKKLLFQNIPVSLFCRKNNRVWILTLWWSQPESSREGTTLRLPMLGTFRMLTGQNHLGDKMRQRPNIGSFPQMWATWSGTLSLPLCRLAARGAAVTMKYRTLVMYMEIGCFVSCLCGWILVCSTLPTEYWTFSEVGSVVLTTSNYFSNLWRDCISDTTGVSDCKDYPSMLALPGR